MNTETPEFSFYFILDGSAVDLAYYELYNLVNAQFNSIISYQHSTLNESKQYKTFFLYFSSTTNYADILEGLIVLNRQLAYTKIIGRAITKYQVDFLKTENTNLKVLTDSIFEQKRSWANIINSQDSFKITLETIGSFTSDSKFSKEDYYHWIPQIAHSIYEITDATIDLKESFHDINFLCWSTGSIILGIELFRVNRLWLIKHAPKNRVYFNSASMNPYLIRSMINFGITTLLLRNMKASPSDCTFLDPFMGGGGMIIEAIDMHFESFGIELFYWTGRGARANIKDFEKRMAKKQLSWNLIHADSQKIPLKSNSINLIVTDVPYGINSPLKGIGLNELLELSLKECLRVLKTNHRLVVCIPSSHQLPTFLYQEKIVFNVSLPLHAELLRVIWVVEKISS